MMQNIEKIHTFAERLLLGENADLNGQNYFNEFGYAVDHVHDILKSKDEYVEYYKFELRLRLAMHFIPLEALNYDPQNDFTRQELITKHIHKNFNRSVVNAKILANTIIKILDKWELDRNSVTKYRDILLENQNYKCNHCKISFIENSSKYIGSTEFYNDKFKPYLINKKDTADIIQYLTPEVDHIKPVSALGDNNLANLQVLCKLCNRAKSNILNIKTLNEINYAGNDIDYIFRTKPSHIQKMLYFVISRSNNQCSKCKSNSKELTMRKIIDNSPFVRSNLYAVCKDCIEN